MKQQITEHFALGGVDKFECPCGCGTGSKIEHFDINLFYLLERIRKRCCEFAGRDVPVFINSGGRCWNHHTDIYARLGKPPTKESTHLLKPPKKICGADASCPAIPIEEFEKICDEEVGNKGGQGTYSTFMHVDTRGHKKRWGK